MPSKLPPLPISAEDSPEGVSAEERLLLAVIQIAASDALGVGVLPNSDPGVRRKLKQEARAWLADENHSDPFSFVWICHHLNISPGKIRSNIEQAESKNIKRSPRGFYAAAQRVIESFKESPEVA